MKSLRLVSVFVFLILLGGGASLAGEPYPLWDPAEPVPSSGELTAVEGTTIHVLKQHVPDEDGYDWLHGVALAWHDGKLYASFGHNSGKENTVGEEGRGRISEDGGKTWGPVFTIDVGDELNLAISHGVFASHDGRLWALLGAFYGSMENVHTRAYLLDEATGQWEKKGVVVEGGFWPMQEPLKMDDGNWIMAGISVAGGFGGTDDPAAVAISHGDDFTKWDLVVIPKPADLVMWGESTVIVDGNRVLNIARYGDKTLAMVATSEDYGRNWTTSQESNLPMATSKPYAGTLSTGQRYLVCTTTADSGQRRSPLTIAVSRPGEETFSRVYRIRDAVDSCPGESHPKASLSYPYAIEHNGYLYVGYSNSGGRRMNRNSAEVAVIPVESLKVD